MAHNSKSHDACISTQHTWAMCDTVETLKADAEVSRRTCNAWIRTDFSASVQQKRLVMSDTSNSRDSNNYNTHTDILLSYTQEYLRQEDELSVVMGRRLHHTL